MAEVDISLIGEGIKIKRIQQHISQMELAKQLGISQTHLSNAENGRVTLSLKTLFKLKTIFHCTLDELVDPSESAKVTEHAKKTPRYKLVRCVD